MRSEAARLRALDVLERSGIGRVWQQAGCRVNLIGSVRMGLIATHRDIDMHVYSCGITEGSSFAIAARMAADPCVTEIKCINGLHTDERCMAWHVQYLCDGEMWKFDIIHIEEGSLYDGYFERMADRIVEVMTPAQRHTILELKFAAPEGSDIRGVEFYEAVIADGVDSAEALDCWLGSHRAKEPYYWIP